MDLGQPERKLLIPPVFCGKRVALVERCQDLGGAGINTGTLPSKTLRETALALSGIKARHLHGVDGVLIAAGRSSNTADLNLAAAGITPGKCGILTVDEHYRTEVKHIYAVGDVIGPPALASTSMEQARVAVCHLCDTDFLTKVATTLPMGIYTIPEVGMVGETEQSLKEKNIEYVVGKAPYIQSARGKIIGDKTGFLKLIFRKSDWDILGVHIIGEQATELVHIGLIAMTSGGGFNLLKETCFTYPSLGELYRHAALDALIKHRVPRDGR